MHSKYILGGYSDILHIDSMSGDKRNNCRSKLLKSMMLQHCTGPSKESRSFHQNTSHTLHQKLHELQSALSILNTQNHTKAVSLCH